VVWGSVGIGLTYDSSSVSATMLMCGRMLVSEWDHDCRHRFYDRVVLSTRDGEGVVRVANIPRIRFMRVLSRGSSVTEA